MSPIRALARGVSLAVLLAAVACSLAVDLAPYSAGCGAGTKRCSVNGKDTCVSTGDQFYGCARPGCVPCSEPNAGSICDRAGQCSISVCNAGFFDCDNDSSNGCEVNGNTDYDHCGTSAVACMTKCADTFNNVMTLNVASVHCSGGQCTVDQCKPGFRDCDGAVTNGCEKDLTGSTCGLDKMSPCCGLCSGCPPVAPHCDMTASPPKCVPNPVDAGSTEDAARDGAAVDGPAGGG